MNFKALSRSSVRWLSLIGLAGVVSGCASIGGSGNYSCTGMPGEEDQVGCMSVREVYDATDQADYKGEGLEEGEESESSEQGGTASAVVPSQGLPASRGIDPLNVPDNYVAPNMPDRPVPVRTPSQVMRVWISAWENDDGDLVTPGYLYTEIEPRRWVLGDETGPNTSRSFAPLDAR